MRNSRASNKSGTITNFEDRRMYDELIPEAFPIPGMDLWANSYYYGRINDKGDSIFLAEGFLKPIVASNNKEIYAANFVADAFSDWKAYYTKLLNKKGRGSLLKSLEPIKCWMPIHELYHTYITDKYSRFMQYAKKYEINKEIHGFNDFVEYFVKFNQIDKEYPVCRSTFTTSRYANPYISGLVIDLQGIPQDIDFQKQRRVFDEDFEIYNKSLNKFGFRVNLHAPWVIISDIKSLATKSYIKKYTDNNVWDEFYFKAYESDIETLKRYLTHFYNSFVVSTKHPCHSRDILQPQQASAVSDVQWFIWYTYIKVSEANFLG